MLLGQLSALGTSVFFSATSTFFTMAGRIVSSPVVNRTRVILALLFLTIAHFLFRIPLPIDIETRRLYWLSLSGVIGLALGDALLFQAFVWIGPRLSMLMMSLAPVFAALLSWLIIRETLSTGQVIGMLLTIGGVTWVVMDRPGNLNEPSVNKNVYILGILFGIGAALGQAGGLLTAKFGLDGDFPAISGTLIRILAAAIVLWVIALIQKQGKINFIRLRENPKSLGFIILGALFGPTIGVTLSLVAVQRVPVGIAATLSSLAPIFLLPIGYFVFGERFGWQSITGTILAISGVTMLFLV